MKQFSRVMERERCNQNMAKKGTFCFRFDEHGVLSECNEQMLPPDDAATRSCYIRALIETLFTAKYTR